MARWALCWILVIMAATSVSYFWSSNLVSSDTLSQANLAMQPIGELGSPVCTRATRALLAVAAGASADATPQDRQAWERASRAVLLACGQA